MAGDLQSSPILVGDAVAEAFTVGRDDDECAAWPQDAQAVAQGAEGVGQMLDHVPERYRVEGAVGVVFFFQSSLADIEPVEVARSFERLFIQVDPLCFPSSGGHEAEVGSVTAADIQKPSGEFIIQVEILHPSACLGQADGPLDQFGEAVIEEPDRFAAEAFGGGVVGVVVGVDFVKLRRQGGRVEPDEAAVAPGAFEKVPLPGCSKKGIRKPRIEQFAALGAEGAERFFFSQNFRFSFHFGCFLF